MFIDAGLLFQRNEPSGELSGRPANLPSDQDDPNTAATYAAQFSQWSLTNPILYSVGFDDLVNRMEHLQVDSGIAVPGTVITDTLNATKSANPNLKFAVTLYEDQLSSPLLGDSNLPASTRAGVDYVQLYVHYRGDGPNYATYLQQTKAIFPNAKIIAGAYAYDRIDYLPCLPQGVPCTTQQEEDFFQQLFQLQLSELQQGLVDQIEFFPGYFGLEAQWPDWATPRRCAPTRLQGCIANTLAMRQAVLQDLTSAFGAPGPLTSLSPRPLVFPVQNVSTTSGASTVTLNNPGSAPLVISSIAIVGGNASEFSQQNSCPASLAANTNCSINITFTPAAVGTRASQLSVTDNARRSPHFMDLNGVGADSSSPQVLLSPSTLDFQNQTVGTTSAPLAVLLSNPGGGSLSISTIAITGSSASQFAQTNNCISGVAPAGSCTINVTFTPATADNQSAQLVITDNAVGSPHTIPLLGLGSDPASAQISLSKTALTFDSQIVNTASAAQSVTLSNPGTAALTISGITLAGRNIGDFSETNTCGTGLAAGQSCNLTVTFKPSGVGPRTAQALIADNANGSPQPVTLNGTGAATPTPVASVSPASVTFPSQTVNTTSAAMAVTLSNTGTAALAITSVGISGADAAEFAQTNTCGSTLDAGANCLVNVSFTPSAPGARSARLQITDNAAGSPQSITLNGSGTATPTPIATISPASLTFPTQTVQTTSTAMPVTLSNTGSAGLTLTSIGISGTNAGEFAQTNTCGSTLAAGANCTVSVSFTPSATGARSAQLQIIDNAAGSPQSITLSGSGTATPIPIATILPALLTFPSQTVKTTSTAMPVIFSNTGSAALTLTSIGISGANAADFAQTNTCGSTLAAGANCTVSVSFTPSAPGTRSAQLQIIDNAAGSPQSIALSGSGTTTPTPIATISPASLTFPTQTVQTTSTAMPVALSNTGSAALTLTSIAISGPNAAEFAQTNTCGSTLASGANCTVSVSFTPSATGARSAQLQIIDNAAGSPQSVTLSGAGIATATPTATISPTSLTFPSQTVQTTSSAMSVTLSNTGSAVLTLTSIAISGPNAAEFAQTNTCGSTLASGANCTVSVSFTPSATGARSAQLQIIDNAAGSPQSVTLSGAGIATATPTATISPTSLTFPSQTVQTTSSAMSVTLSNTGSAVLTLTSIAISGANAADFAQTNMCGSTLASGANCTVSVSFTPSATGARSAQLQITDNAAGSPQTVALTGTGVVVAAPAVTLTPASLSFGNQSVGLASAASAVVLANTGNSALTVGSISVAGANAPDFAQTNTCTAAIAPAASCSISVVFTPAMSGPRSAQIIITDNASGSPQQVPLSGTGANATAPDFSISAAPQSATLAPGQSKGFTLSVSASGGFSQAVTFACSGLPAAAACSFSPASVTPGSSSPGTTTLTLTTVSRSGGLLQFPAPFLPLSYEIALRISVICLLLCLYKMKNSIRIASRPRLAASFAAIFLLLAGSIAGCANASNPPVVSGAGGTPAGAYAVSVTASSGNITHQLNLSITVQ